MVQKLFPVIDQQSQKDHIQSRLMVIASLAMISYGIILTLAPVVRLHSSVEPFRFSHWLGTAVWFSGFIFLHQQTVRKLRQRDPFLLPIVAMLSGLGLMTIYRLYPNLGLRQTIWLAIACLLVFIGNQFPGYLLVLRRYKYLWLTAALLMTGLTIVLGVNPNGVGPRLWFEFLGVHFQPSELLKILLITFLAGYFSDQVTISRRFIDTLLPNLIIILTAILLLIFQRDLGTASIFLMIYFAMLIISHRNRMIIWLSPLLFVGLGIIGYFLMDTVQIRINTWLHPFRDPSGQSYQIIQSLIAIAEGSLIGTGPGLGSPNLVPVSVSDFIFSAIAEEFGFFGLVFIILLYFFLIYSGTKIALNSENAFFRYLVFGLSFYFGIQSILIIGGNIGLLPLTGVTLPFVSYGGSSLIISFSAFLMILSASSKNPNGGIPIATPQKRSVLMSGFLLAILITEIITASLISFWFQAYLVQRPENPRWIINDRYVARGDIVDRTNSIIITNIQEPGANQRVSNYIPLYPVVGYTNPTYGQTGIEASMFQYLRGYDGYPLLTQTINDLLYNQPPEGLDVRLTIDLRLQRSADEELSRVLNEDEGGAIIVMNAQTGEILSMSSHPYFNAADLDAEWASLSEDPASPLLNRATQGLYPPGAILSPFFAASEIEILENSPDPAELFSGYVQNKSCALPVENEPTWQALISNGCEFVLPTLSGSMNPDLILNFLESLGFFSKPRLNLEVAEVTQPQIPGDNMLESDSFLISPLQLALISSALTNQGVKPGVRIVNAYRDPDGNWITLPKLESNIQVLDVEASTTVIELIEYQNESRWETTAIAENEKGEIITWFIAGTAPGFQGQPLTIVVLLERNAPTLARKIGIALLQEASFFTDNTD